VQSARSPHGGFAGNRFVLRAGDRSVLYGVGLQQTFSNRHRRSTRLESA